MRRHRDGRSLHVPILQPTAGAAYINLEGILHDVLRVTCQSAGRTVSVLGTSRGTANPLWGQGAVRLPVSTSPRSQGRVPLIESPQKFFAFLMAYGPIPDEWVIHLSLLQRRAAIPFRTRPELHQIRLQRPLTLSSTTIAATGKVEVSFDVKNTAERAGSVTPQLYTHQRKSTVVQPIKSLRSFRRIELQPGETTPVTFSLPASQLAFYDTPSHDFKVEPGTFDILVGDSSDDILLRGHLDVTRR